MTRHIAQRADGGLQQIPDWGAESSEKGDGAHFLTEAAPVTAEAPLPLGREASVKGGGGRSFFTQRRWPSRKMLRERTDIIDQHFYGRSTESVNLKDMLNARPAVKAFGASDRRLAWEFRHKESLPTLLEAHEIVKDALQRWQGRSMISLYGQPGHLKEGVDWNKIDQAGLMGFYQWGQVRDPMAGLHRALGLWKRHFDWAVESVHRGLITPDLHGQDVLVVGSKTAGDILFMAGLGANVTAVEEDPYAAYAARELVALVEAHTTILSQSPYKMNENWHHQFDIIYGTGFAADLEDPLAFLEMCYRSLKRKGRMVIKTLSQTGMDAVSGQEAQQVCADVQQTLYGEDLTENWLAPTRETLGRLIA